MKTNGLCRRCGGPKRGRALAAVASAQCWACGDEVCEKHVEMIDGEWICSKCKRKPSRQASPA